MKYLKYKKPDYSNFFWEYLEKQNLLKRGSYHDIKYSIINIKKTGDILYSDLTNERKFYKWLKIDCALLIIKISNLNSSGVHLNDFFIF